MKATDKNTERMRVVTRFTVKIPFGDGKKESLRDDTIVIKSRLKNRR
jgi:hypothetical protein